MQMGIKMATYSIIADTSDRLLKKMQEYLVPRVLKNKNTVALCSPESKEDYSVGIYLYHIKEAEEIRRAGMVSIGSNRQSRAPLYLTLYYMITAYSASDVKFRMIEEEKLLGGIFQFCWDNPIIPKEELYTGKEAGMDAHLHLLRIETDERSKIWSFKDISYKPSVFIAVTPILLQSDYSAVIPRVKEAEFQVRRIEDEEKGNQLL